MRSIFENKTILITGGTGFLGRALTKEILKHKPKSIRIFSRDEVKHHYMQEEFGGNIILRHFLGDVRDAERLMKAARGCDIVVHAAALKRLDLLEYNVDESIKTNILGTQNVVRASLYNNVERAVFISSDKACSPVNTYGACKFVSERIFIESNFSKGDCPTKFICVRYGNVIESTGSVIPFFEERIVKNQAIPLTDPRMTRFIITSDEAVDLIKSAITWGIGGEVFVPRLPSMKITDLIEILIKKHKSKVNTKVIGIRPGEKIHEEMINRSEIDRTYEYDNLYVITSQIQKYSENVSVPAYYKGRKLTEADMTVYSSKDSVVRMSEVEKILKKAGLLQDG